MAKHITATEVLARQEEMRKRSDETLANIFIEPLSQLLLRRVKRALLQSALEGTSDDRMHYCKERAIGKYLIQLACFGSTVYSPEVIGDRIIWWYKRLERIAQRKSSKSILRPLPKPAGAD